MKQCPPRVRASSSKSAPAAKLRLLKKCLHELQALYAEAISILNELWIRPSTEIVRDLWARKDLGVFEEKYTANVPGHGVVLVQVR